MVSAAGSLPRVRPPAARPWVIAHRGASAAFRENTIEAFRAASVLGADAVELDVRRTADGRPVVHHDPVVPGVGPICSFPAAELRRRAPWVPGLEEALAACAGMWVDVEVKNSPTDPDWDPDDALVGEVVPLLSAGGRAGRILLSSFNQAALARARALAPSLPTGLLADRLIPLPAAIRTAAQAGHRVFLPHAAVLAGSPGPDGIRAAHEAGLLVVAWTVDDPGELHRLAAAGIDGVITNRPDEALSALGDHRHHDRS
jgi:glycerophosphoryl diester phosphodiesterase